MRRRQTFRPEALGPLEERVTLSRIAATATIGPVAGESETFKGSYTTTVPTGFGGGDTTILTGSAKLGAIGKVSLNGKLGENVSIAPPFNNLSGTLTFSSRKVPGTLVFTINGPEANLAPTAKATAHFSFTVTTATGGFSSFAGTGGTGALTLTPKGHVQDHQAHGSFVLKLTSG